MLAIAYYNKEKPGVKWRTEIRHLQDGTLLHTFPTTNNWIRKLKISPDGTLLITVSGGKDGIVQIWQIAQERLLNTFSLGPKDGPIYDLLFDPNGQFITIQYEDKELQIRGFPDGRLYASRQNKDINVSTSTYLDDTYLFNVRLRGFIGTKVALKYWPLEHYSLIAISSKKTTKKQLLWIFEKLYFLPASSQEQRWLEFFLSCIFWYRQNDPEFQVVFDDYLVRVETPPAIREIAIAMGYAPQNPPQKALFYFLTQQWSHYEDFDFDQSLLKGIYETANPPLRQQIRQIIRGAGRSDFISIITNSKQHTQIKGTTSNEAEIIITILVEKKAWAKLWAMTFELPFEASLQIVKILTQNSWQPTAEGDKGIFESLVPLVHKKMLTAQSCADYLPLAIQQAKVRVPGRINDLEFSPQHPLIAIGTGQGVAVLWNFETAERLWKTKVNHSIAQITFTSDDILLFSERRTHNNDPCAIYSYHLTNKQHITRLGQHTGQITALEALGNAQFLTTGRDGRVALWQGQKIQHEIMMAKMNWPRGAFISGTGQRAGILTKQGIILLDVSNLLTSSKVLIKTRAIPRQAVFVTDHKTVIFDQVRSLFTANSQGKKSTKPTSVNIRHSDLVQSIILTLGGSMLITADAKGQVNFIQWPNQMLYGSLQIRSKRLTSLHVSPDGAFMAVGDSNASFSLWDLRPASLHLMLNQALSQALPSHLAALLALRQNKNLPVLVQNTLSYLEIVLRHRFRYDIELSPSHDILAGDFDIELEA